MEAWLGAPIVAVESRSSSPASRPVLGLALGFWATFLLWGGFLFLQNGHEFDEAEHAHITWLRAHEHLEEQRDFFQHHQPVLWDVLGLFFRLGGQGFGVLYFGRAVVVLCALATALALSRSRSTGSKQWFSEPGAIGLACLVLATGLLPPLFAIRPETLATALFAVGLALWWIPEERINGRRQVLDLLAGICVGAACFSTPRFLVAGGAFLLGTYEQPRLFQLNWSRLAILGAGAIVVPSFYLAFTDFSLDLLLFNLRFSAALQKVGPGNSVDVPRELQALGLFVAAGALLVAGLDRHLWRRVVARASYIALVALVGLLTAGHYPYPQSFSPVVLLVAFEMTLLASARTGVDHLRRLSAKLLVWTAPAVVLVSAVLQVSSGRDLASWISRRVQVGALCRPGAKVLANYAKHPLFYRDSSYYGPPLNDGVDRLCEAVRAFDTVGKLPTCDLTSQIVDDLPDVVGGEIRRLVPLEGRKAVEATLRDRYRAIGGTVPLPDGRELKQVQYWIKKDRDPAADLQEPAPTESSE
jgi:hypothetical protein